MDRMIFIDHTIFIQLVNFIVAIIALNFLLIKPVRNRMAARRTLIEGISGEIDQFTATAAEKLSGYEAALTEAKTAAARAREALKSEAEALEGEMIGNARAAADVYLENARQDYSRVRKTAKEALLNEVNAMAALAAKKLLD
ncbi:MAG: ATP synthase F0 subunit B [Desulfovibrio sp.]|jgi:F-type H+-transporting ATPase subunit b|nr:ATP synthase F0 subunit B [Desulfovibrio sp.]